MGEGWTRKRFPQAMKGGVCLRTCKAIIPHPFRGNGADMAIKATSNSEASLNLTGKAIQVAATYEIHLTGDDLRTLSRLGGLDGVPGALVDAINHAVKGNCNPGGA